MHLVSRHVGLALVVLLAACADDASSRGGRLILATTTSVEDTGLLEELSDGLRSSIGLRVRVIAVGSGQALELARRGDADVVLVHAPQAEEEFVAARHGDARRTIMRNDFVLVGPPDDPASARAAGHVTEALRRIAASASPFLSRADSSGTHRKERELWDSAGLRPGRGWYREVGLGQAELLRMASERGAYTLTDRGTFRYLESGLRLRIIQSDGRLLDNPYSVIVSARARNPAAATAVAEWLAGDAARVIIARHGADRFGGPLFEPVP